MSRQVVDGVLFSETNVEVPYQRLMAEKNTNSRLREGVQIHELNVLSDWAFLRFLFFLQRTVGRPRISLPKETIEGYFDMGYSVSQTAEACGVSRSALYCRMQQLGISYRDQFSSLDNNSLDREVRDIKINHPNCGEVMITGHLEQEE